MPIVVLLALLLASWTSAQTLTVFAAASLTESLEEAAALIETRQPGTAVSLSFAGSSILSFQLIQGAPADVFASANIEQMQRLAEAGLLAADPVAFASNRLVVIAPRGSPLTNFTQLAEDGVAVVLAGPEVPVGRYSRAAIESYTTAEDSTFAAAVAANVVSEEQNVRLVATKIALGEADAGIVYATDAAAFPELVVIDVPAAYNPAVSYVVAVLRDAPQPGLAEAFIDLLLSGEGRAILGSRGFGVPVQ